MTLTAAEKTTYRQSKQFKLLRQNKIIEASNRCNLCQVKKAKGLHLHHIDESKYCDDDEGQYTVVLCATCHKFFEQKIKVLLNKKNPENENTVRLRQLLQPYTNITL